MKEENKQLKEDITYCNGCHCMTHSIRKARAKFICGKCGHNKTIGDIYQYELGRKNKLNINEEMV